MGEARCEVIDRTEILDTASRLSLNPHVVEKDYVLGWMLAGISQHTDIGEQWVFKGGTCLKKCWFETYRFSEDLDFTLIDAAHLDETFLRRVFGEIGDWIYETTGIEVPAGGQNFEIYGNPRGNPSCLGRISYIGPVSPRSGGLPRIKLDLTADERIVLPPVRVDVFHPYSDVPVDGISILAYAYEEAFGEKFRALAERTRPRDLYDVVNLYRNEDARPAAAVFLDVLQQKCAFKGIALPRLEDLERSRATLEGGWVNMLGHQLPALPPVDAFWNELPAIFAWLDSGRAPEAPAAFAMRVGETVLRERGLRLPVSGTTQSALEVIRFAAANHLLVELGYQGSRRRIEPYSLRRSREGNVTLEAHNVERDEHRSYRVDRIESARVTNDTFVPRYAIELTPAGPVSVAPRATRASPASIGGIATPRQRAVRSLRRQSVDWGPKYVFECTACGRKFTKKRMDPQLNPHKGKDGYPCYGRYGMHVETKY